MLTWGGNKKKPHRNDGEHALVYFGAILNFRATTMYHKQARWSRLSHRWTDVTWELEAAAGKCA